MLGGVVRGQRLGGRGFVEVTLGRIKDFSTTSFTLDSIPESIPDHTAMGYAFADWSLATQHPYALNERFDAVARLMGKAGSMRSTTPPPLVGAVYPPAESPYAPPPPPNAEGVMPQPPPSLFFVNDSVYRGSAGAVLLHSKYLEADTTTLPPSIPVHKGAGALTAETTFDRTNGMWRIGKLDGATACDFIKALFETDEGLKANKASRLSLIVRVKETAGASGENAGEVEIPLAFRGHPEQNGIISVAVPPCLASAIQDGRVSEVFFARDDVTIDSELIATDLARYQAARMTRTAGFYHAGHRITIDREGAVTVPAASGCVLHFSHPGLYTIARRSDAVTFGENRGEASLLSRHAPSVASRVLGDEIPNMGIYSGGPLMPVKMNGMLSSFVAPRTSTHVVLRSKMNVE
jgi:hypothetical protein